MASKFDGFSTATHYDYVGRPRYAKMKHPDGTIIAADISALPDDWEGEGFEFIEMLADGVVPEGLPAMATPLSRTRGDSRFLTPQERAGFAMAAAEAQGVRIARVNNEMRRAGQFKAMGLLDEVVDEMVTTAEDMRSTVARGEALTPAEPTIVADSGEVTDSTFAVPTKPSGVREAPDEAVPSVTHTDEDAGQVRPAGRKLVQAKDADKGPGELGKR